MRKTNRMLALLMIGLGILLFLLLCTMKEAKKEQKELNEAMERRHRRERAFPDYWMGEEGGKRYTDMLTFPGWEYAIRFYEGGETKKIKRGMK